MLITRKSFVKCVNCGHEALDNEMEIIEDWGHLCYQCYDREDGYNSTNDEFKNKSTKKGITFGIEFETNRHNYNVCRLYKLGFIPTSDGSINGKEWKSPIFNSLKGIKEKFDYIDKYGVNDYVTDGCGTHIHVGTIDREEKYLIHRFRKEIFIPLQNFLCNNEENTKQVWGRFFVSYADSRLGGDHYSWLNTNTEHPTIEWRLAKYRNAEQFYNLLQIVTKLTEIVINNIRKNECYKQWYNDRYNEELIKKVESCTKRLSYQLLKEYRLLVQC